MAISYKTNAPVELDAVIEVYKASTLGERRPVDDRERIQRMIDNADLIITAWDGDLMVGIARSVTDWAYCCYLSDLAVRESHQRQGIGKELIRRTQAEIGEQTALILLAAPKAVGYYGHIGMKQHPSAWVLRPGDKL